ncbi:hypothetical protein GWK47_008374 [Chionoecetes opilio]|uniref:Uncharacterized protein n=1 Tax=Chionoecetes opilio TaxID=41210 RepID=A0A8J4Y582_CHIOP|nr:hypothetical protein GWK47_008374 [Chionoecetes opilio]
MLPTEILENLVPNPTAISDLSAQHINPRTGRKARRRTLPSDAPARIKTLLSTSLPHIGPKLFNNLPGKLRNLTECSVEKFKHHLDNHQQTIPDEPPVPGYTSVSRADTNSISDQANLQHRDAGFRCSGGAPRLSTRSSWSPSPLTVVRMRQFSPHWSNLVLLAGSARPSPFQPGLNCLAKTVAARD